MMEHGSSRAGVKFHTVRKIGRIFWHLPRNIFIAQIDVYQHTLSPDHGFLKRFFPYGYCKFSPSCSQYMKERLKVDGLVIGLAKGCWQILRCNPWGKGNRMRG